MLLEVFSKERLVGEVQVIGYFLDALGGVFQHEAYFQYALFVYPFVGGALADLLHVFRQVFGRDAQLLSIPADTSFLTEIFFHQFDELGKDSFWTSPPVA